MYDTSVVLTPVPLDQLEQRIAEVIRKELDARDTKDRPSPNDELLTRKAAAEVLGVSLPTLHEYTQRGIIPAHRLGSRVRYKRAELIAALESIRPANTRRK
ncbi:MAG: helix-turn-helix domain-containing protein [Flavobacteriales bacterium]